MLHHVSDVIVYRKIFRKTFVENVFHCGFGSGIVPLPEAKDGRTFVQNQRFWMAGLFREKPKPKKCPGLAGGACHAGEEPVYSYLQIFEGDINTGDYEKRKDGGAYEAAHYRNSQRTPEVGAFLCAYGHGQKA